MPNALPLPCVFHITSFTIAILASKQNLSSRFSGDYGTILIIYSADCGSLPNYDSSLSVETHRSERFVYYMSACRHRASRVYPELAEHFGVTARPGSSGFCPEVPDRKSFDAGCQADFHRISKTPLGRHHIYLLPALYSTPSWYPPRRHCSFGKEARALIDTLISAFQSSSLSLRLIQLFSSPEVNLGNI